MTSGWRAAFASLLALGMMVASIWVYIFGAVAPFWLAEFGMSRTQLGMMTMLLFAVGAFGSLAAGRLVDLVDDRRLFIGIFAAAALTTLVIALAPNLWWLYCASAVGGLVMAAGNPTTNKLIARLVPLSRQGGVMGVKQAGVQGGVLFAGVLPPLALAVGWRMAVASTFLLHLIGAGAAMRLLPERARIQATVGARVWPVKENVYRIAAYAFFMGSGVAIIYTYFPLFAFESIGIPITTVGAMVAAGGVAGIVARLGWGKVAEHLPDFSILLLLIAVISLISTGLTWGAGDVGAAWMLWLAVVGFGVSASAWNVVGMLAVVAESEVNEVGVASGVVQFGFYGGFILSPIAFGYSVDQTGTYTWGWLGVAIVFLASVGLTLRWRALTRRTTLTNEQPGRQLI